ncbi:MAG: hypothetical protein JSW62_04970 [Thermoplasmatales archaeon]|nr:MAG: hypothetical protein JSW62_04970 [Thermoplasmatales archaeon]
MVKNHSVSMNEEFKKWVEEKKEEIKNSKHIKKTSRKKPTGKCQICGEKISTYICLKCEKSICKSCYFKIIGVCKNCVPPEISKKWDGSRPDWEKELGVEWVG